MSAVTPASPAEAAEALADATRARRSVAIVGGGTRSRRGRPGPATDRTLRTTGMARVVAHEPHDLTLTVEAGIRASEVERIAASAGQAWPQADVREGSTLGGVLATASSGRGRLGAGPVRDSVLEIVVATGDGRLVTAGGRTVKGVSGFDIPRLAVGSLGTLGVIVQATIKLWPLPAVRGWFAAGGSLEERLAAAQDALALPARPSAVLLGPERVAVELTGPADDVHAPGGFVALGGPPPEPTGAGIVEAGVPAPRLADLARELEGAGLVYEAWMGVGICRVAVPSAEAVGEVRRHALALGGHASVVDGPAELRADPWGPPPPGVHLMRRLRDAFDPGGILNPDLVVWT